MPSSSARHHRSGAPARPCALAPAEPQWERRRRAVADPATYTDASDVFRRGRNGHCRRLRSFARAKILAAVVTRKARGRGGHTCTGDDVLMARCSPGDRVSCQADRAARRGVRGAGGVPHRLLLAHRRWSLRRGQHPRERRLEKRTLEAERLGGVLAKRVMPASDRSLLTYLLTLARLDYRDTRGQQRLAGDGPERRP